MTSEALSDVIGANNYMNIVFIVFASAATAFSMTFCENGKEQKLTQYGRYTTVCCLCLLIILLALSPVFLHVYFGQVSTYAWGLLLIGTLTVAIDGVITDGFERPSGAS